MRDQQYLQGLGYEFACVVRRVMVEFDANQQRKRGLRGTFEKRGAFGDTIKKLGLVGLACGLERMRFGLVCFWGANCGRVLFVLHSAGKRHHLYLMGRKTRYIQQRQAGSVLDMLDILSIYRNKVLGGIVSNFVKVSNVGSYLLSLWPANQQ